MREPCGNALGAAPGSIRAGAARPRAMGLLHLAQGWRNQAVFAFRRYEDASLRYTGIESHEGLTHYGLYDTVVARESGGKSGSSGLRICSASKWDDSVLPPSICMNVRSVLPQRRM